MLKMPADYFRGTGLLTILFTIFVRWCVSLYPYSGAGKPPMYGDYEAQRHWMEITYNLPAHEWYFNSSKNSLEYWGLDYPPLTAYHSKLCGLAASWIDPDFVSLNTSRGYESPNHKLFMRATVIIADLLVLYPAVWLFWKSQGSRKQRVSDRHAEGDGQTSEATGNLVWKYLLLMYPGLILIDHGHFQYNGISLGLAIAAAACILNQKNMFASALFVLSISYKQMSLYYALPFFFYLLGFSLNRGIKSGIYYITLLGVTVLGTLFITWFPFIVDLKQFLQVLHRVFPLSRGVFEDKVANVWCALNVVYKLRIAFTNEAMAKICLCTTILAVLPSCINILWRPKPGKFIPALINSSMAFFLFSFQVHEKSILLVAIPVLLYMPSETLCCAWFLIISVFSMLPLLIKDGLIVPAISLTLFYIVSLHLMVGLFRPDVRKVNSKVGARKGLWSVPLGKILFCTSITGCIFLTLGALTLKPPSHLPDLFPVLISVYSCAHFCIFFLYFNYCQIVKSSSTKFKKM